MSQTSSRFARIGMVSCVWTCFAVTGLIGCGSSSSQQLADRETPEFKETLKRSANAYIDREAELKKSRGKAKR